MLKNPLTCISLILAYFLSFNSCATIDLTNSNIDDVLKSNELVIVDFYASWCYFSNVLDPIFTEASNKLDAEYKDKGKVVLGKVDCEKEADIARKYTIRKYPTLKVFRYGEQSKHEYRGARNVDAFVEFARQQLIDPIKYLEDDNNIPNESGNNNIIFYLKSKEHVHLDMIKKISKQLREDCSFFVVFGAKDTQHDAAIYRVLNEPNKIYSNFEDQDSLKQWIIKSCTPVVRNITFQNAEDITEEGRPLVLLFYNPSKPEITAQFSKFITDYLMDETSSVNFVFADGQKFSHPLMHLGKSESDLPLIAMDSFQHMFLLNKSVKEALIDPAILKKFISDLHSGKLHREFHNGPDPVPAIEQKVQSGDTGGQNKDKSSETTPLPSVFKKLMPNSNRYTFHDEF